MVEQYKQFISATGYRLLPDISKSSPTDNYPVVGVSWDDVVAYLRQVGRRSKPLTNTMNSRPDKNTGTGRW